MTLVEGGLVEDASARLTARSKALAEAYLSTKGTPPRAKLLAALTANYLGGRTRSASDNQT